MGPIEGLQLWRGESLFLDFFLRVQGMTLGLYRDNGKENGNYQYSGVIEGLGFRVIIWG